MLDGVDVSYAQGNYKPGAESFVIVNASRGNIGLAVGSEYHTQVANARAAGKHVGHYFFNGNIDPVTCADFFVNNLTYQAGDSLWLDVEAEGSTGTVAWSPASALAFINRVKARTGVTPGVYLNKSLMNGSNWSAVVAAGAPLWIAYYNPSPPPIQWWPTWTVWQYTSTPIDRNKAQVASLSPAGGGAVPINNDPTPSISLEPEMKMVGVPKGTVALLTPTSGTKYSDPNAFEYIAALAAYGPIQDHYTGADGVSHPFTEDQISNLVSVANARGAAIAAQVKIAAPVVPAPVVDFGPVLAAISGMKPGTTDLTPVLTAITALQAKVGSLTLKAS